MDASSLALLSAAALAAGGAGAALGRRALRAMGRERAALAERLAELAGRLEAVEREVGRAALRAEVAESVLLEKGIADEDDLELMRRQIEVSVGAGYERERDGDLH